MRNEVNVDGKNITTDLNIWTGYFKIEVDGRKVLSSYKLTYLSIVLLIIAIILTILATSIWYQIGYNMGMQGMKPLFPRFFGYISKVY